jgi:5'-3' exonuclease
MPKGYMLIDGNSIGHYANNANKLTIGELEVHAIYGFLRTLKSIVTMYPQMKPIVLWDGVSWRKMLFPDYKEIRERQGTKAEQIQFETKEGYKKQAPYIKKALRLLGVPQVFALNMEADDLAAIISDRYVAQGHKVLLVSGDKDWLQLVGPNVSWRDIMDRGNGRAKIITPANFEEELGVKTIRQFVEMKALCGDQGDSVPGVGGIGEKGAKDFLKAFGDFATFLNMVTFGEVKLADLHKKYRALVEDEQKALTFKLNLDLVDLRTPVRPAPVSLTIDKGNPSLTNFRKFCELLLFRSIYEHLEDWQFVFPGIAEEDPPFDPPYTNRSIPHAAVQPS